MDTDIQKKLEVFMISKMPDMMMMHLCQEQIKKGVGGSITLEIMMESIFNLAKDYKGDKLRKFCEIISNRVDIDTDSLVEYIEERRNRRVIRGDEWEWLKSKKLKMNSMMKLSED